MKKQNVFVKNQKDKDKNLDFVKSEYNINEIDKKKVPAWLFPLFFILLILALLIFLLPKYINNYQTKSEEQNSIQNDFLINANSVVQSKYARIYNNPSVEGNTIITVLFNEPLKLISEKKENGFYAVKTYDGIEGYIQEKNITFDLNSIQSDSITNQVIVVNGDKSILSDASNGNIMAVAPMGSILYADYVTEQVVRVVLPDNQIGWLNRENVVVFSINEKIPAAEEKQADIFTSSALKFLNVPYIPFGLSLDGIDMPGVIYLAAYTNGLDMPRLIEEQAESGYQISFERDTDNFPYIEGFKVGDLLFFSDSSGKKIESVGVFLGEDNILYGFGNQSKIEIVSLNSNEKLFKELQVVRRLFEYVISED